MTDFSNTPPPPIMPSIGLTNPKRSMMTTTMATGNSSTTAAAAAIQQDAKSTETLSTIPPPPPPYIRLGNHRTIITSTKCRPWSWKAFTSSARPNDDHCHEIPSSTTITTSNKNKNNTVSISTTPFFFHHWVPSAVEYADYPYARFNVHLDSLLTYTNEEYARYLEDDSPNNKDENKNDTLLNTTTTTTTTTTIPNHNRSTIEYVANKNVSRCIDDDSIITTTTPWTKSETDTLLELAQMYDLRWPIIIDRWKSHYDNSRHFPNRSTTTTTTIPPPPSSSSLTRQIEDLQYRYYQVGSILATQRAREIIEQQQNNNNGKEWTTTTTENKNKITTANTTTIPIASSTTTTTTTTTNPSHPRLGSVDIDNVVVVGGGEETKGGTITAVTNGDTDKNDSTRNKPDGVGTIATTTSSTTTTTNPTERGSFNDTFGNSSSCDTNNNNNIENTAPKEVLQKIHEQIRIEPTYIPALTLPASGTTTLTSHKLFDLHAERMRRAHMNRLWFRSKEEEMEEEGLRAELRNVEAQLRKLKRGGKHLGGSSVGGDHDGNGLGGKIGSVISSSSSSSSCSGGNVQFILPGGGVHKNGEEDIIFPSSSTTSTSSMLPRREMAPIVPSSSSGIFNTKVAAAAATAVPSSSSSSFSHRPPPIDVYSSTHQSVSASFLETAPVPTPGTPYLQSGRLFPPSIKGGGTSSLGLNSTTWKQMNAILSELNVPQDPIPTKRNCDLYDVVRKDALTLLILQKIALKKETELEGKRAIVCERKSRARTQAEAEAAAAAAAAAAAVAATTTMTAVATKEGLERKKSTKLKKNDENIGAAVDLVKEKKSTKKKLEKEGENKASSKGSSVKRQKTKVFSRAEDTTTTTTTSFSNEDHPILVNDNKDTTTVVDVNTHSTKAIISGKKKTGGGGKRGRENSSSRGGSIRSSNKEGGEKPKKKHRTKKVAKKDDTETYTPME